MIHDSWNLDGPEQEQQRVIHFPKNTVLLGAAIASLGQPRRRSAAGRAEQVRPVRE